MLRLGLVVRLWRMVRLVVRLWRMLRLIVRLWNISLPSLALDIVLIVTGSYVFIEECAFCTVKGVLFSVCVTEMINLKYQVVETMVLKGILKNVGLLIDPDRETFPSSVLTDNLSELQLCIAIYGKPETNIIETACTEYNVTCCRPELGQSFTKSSSDHRWPKICSAIHSII